VRISNFTRVATPEGKFVDHLAYLESRGKTPAGTRLSVWDMYLCGSLLLASHLSRSGFSVKLVNSIEADNAEEKFSALRDFAPDIIALSTTFVLTQRHLIDVGQMLRQAFPGAFLVAGGHHVFTTLLHMDRPARHDYLRSSGFDAFVNDTQGEAALLELCRAFPGPFDALSNLIWNRGDGTVVEGAATPENNDVNGIEMDFSLVDPGSIVHVRTARSCSFKCAFCSYPTIAGDLAQMTVENAINMLRKAKSAEASSVIFVDDTFNVPRPRFERLVDRMIEERLDVPWYSFLRGQYIDEKLVGKMARSGCRGVFLGIESGSDRILKNMKKGAIVDFYRNGIRWLSANGIVTVGSFIVGFPGETEETAMETRNFIEESGLDYYFIQPFYYLYHTPIHKRAAEWNLKGEGLFWSHRTMNSTEANDHVNRIFLEVENSIFVNPDYTLWEIAYLRNKGLSLGEIKAYRKTINDMTRNQMLTYGLVRPEGQMSRATRTG